MGFMYPDSGSGLVYGESDHPRGTLVLGAIMLDIDVDVSTKKQEEMSCS